MQMNHCCRWIVKANGWARVCCAMTPGNRVLHPNLCQADELIWQKRFNTLSVKKTHILLILICSGLRLPYWLSWPTCPKAEYWLILKWLGGWPGESLLANELPGLYDLIYVSGRFYNDVLLFMTRWATGWGRGPCSPEEDATAGERLRPGPRIVAPSQHQAGREGQGPAERESFFFSNNISQHPVASDKKTSRLRSRGRAHNSGTKSKESIILTNPPSGDLVVPRLTDTSDPGPGYTFSYWKPWLLEMTSGYTAIYSNREREREGPFFCPSSFFFTCRARSPQWVISGPRVDHNDVISWWIDSYYFIL